MIKARSSYTQLAPEISGHNEAAIKMRPRAAILECRTGGQGAGLPKGGAQARKKDSDCQHPIMTGRKWPEMREV